MIVKAILTKRGDDAMRTDQLELRISKVGVALFVIALAIGVGLEAWTGSPAPLGSPLVAKFSQ